MSESIVVQAPLAKAGRLFVLLHGVGSTAAAMVPLARRIAGAFSDAAVISVPSPFESDLGRGRQWFSTIGITENTREGRIAEVLPLFAQTIHNLQARYEVAPAATTLVGFSQGAIMSLESVRQGQVLAGRVAALAGRFAHLPEMAPQHVVIHFLHGRKDAVVPIAHTLAAGERLKSLGASFTADYLPSTGHEISEEMASQLIERLQANVPLPVRPLHPAR